jgi:hypothetical protein
LIALALIGLVVIQLCPDFVNDRFNTPSASLIALSCLVPFGSFVLAGLRDGLEWFLTRANELGQWLPHIFRPAAPPPDLIAASADVLGIIALIALPIGDSYLFERKLDFYDVPRLTVAKRPNLDEALQKYVDCRADWHETERMPAIIVASEGGASRSAVWTLSVMRMLDAKTGGAFGAHLFAISSVSGGSLGAVTYNIAHRGKFGIPAKAPMAAEQIGFWKDNLAHVVELGRTDLLSSAIADTFTSDMALGFPRRGPTLAHAFEHFWNQQFSPTDTGTLGFLGMRHDGGDEQSCLPQLILNGTDVESGNRLLTSSIALGEAPNDGSTDTVQWRERPFADAVDLIYQRDSDFPASAAVLNSARFPLISPPGRLPHSKGDGTVVASDVRTQDFEVIDGGVFDDYSGRTAWELADAIREDPKWHDRLDPIVVLITNDAEDDPVTCDGASGPPGTAASAQAAASDTATPLQPGQPQGGVGAPEILSSLLGLYNVRGAHARTELATLYRKYCTATAGGTRQSQAPPPPAAVHFDLPAPNVDKGQAAPMNWVLDESSCTYMLGAARSEKKNPDQADKLLQRLKSDAITVGSDTFDAVVKNDPAGCSAP